jgi:hypothetical protein
MAVAIDKPKLRNTNDVLLMSPPFVGDTDVVYNLFYFSLSAKVCLILILFSDRYAVMGAGEYSPKSLSLEEVPNDLDFNMYSSLMGLLAANGASLQLGYNWYWNYKTVYLRLSHTDPIFLAWLAHFFHCSHFDFSGKEYVSVSSSKTLQLGCYPSAMCYILWLHWNECGINVLPLHFADYFSIRTLAFWSMRNGQWTNNSFLIHVGRLNAEEKALLMSLIKDKLGYESRLTMGNNKLAILDPAKLAEELKPYFHQSQLYRLNKK